MTKSRSSCSRRRTLLPQVRCLWIAAVISFALCPWFVLLWVSVVLCLHLEDQFNLATRSSLAGSVPLTVSVTFTCHPISLDCAESTSSIA